MRVLIVALLLMLYSFPAAAQDSGMLTVDLAEDNVNITTGFNGAKLSLFGVKKKQGDIAIVVKGPQRKIVVRRKDQILGIWTNRKSLTFRNVPVYYDIASSKPVNEMAPLDILETNEIGLDYLDFEPIGGRRDDQVEPFKEALIRNKQTVGHYPLEPRKIVFLDSDFFRVNFDVPANVPTGEYVIKTYLLNEGSITDVNETNLYVQQEGFSARVYKFAHYNSFTYGLVAVLFALLAGFSAYMFLRRE